MTMLAIIALAMALAIDTHEARGATPAAPAAENRSEARAMGGPYEPVEPGPQAILVQGERSGPAWTIAPDPALARRYAPRPRRPVETITIRF